MLDKINWVREYESHTAQHNFRTNNDTKCGESKEEDRGVDGVVDKNMEIFLKPHIFY